MDGKVDWSGKRRKPDVDVVVRRMENGEWRNSQHGQAAVGSC